MGAFSLIEQNQLALKLKSISLKELFHLTEAPCDIYSFYNNLFHMVIPKGKEMANYSLKELIMKGHWRFFVMHEDHFLLISAQQQNLRNVTRSLSIGDPKANGKKQMALLSMNLNYLYEDPTNDEILSLQFQSVKNLLNFLNANQKLQRGFYKELMKQDFHYTLKQPLLSSLLLLNFLKQTFHFNHKEMESLFIASYFKDIGMASLPDETYNKQDLTLEEKLALKSHPEASTQILSGRLPIGPAYLNIIENHHSHTLLSEDDQDSINNDNILGVETILVAVMDTITAMTTDRPYRSRKSMFEALNLVKALMANRYPQEFKFLVQFFHQFFKE